MKKLKITPIKNGTVIDHITPGLAVKVLRILKIPESTSSVVSVAINVKSKIGKKDIVKVENRELDTREVDKIALIAPKATINIIRDFEVIDKHRVKLPNEIIGIVKSMVDNTAPYRIIIQDTQPFKVDPKDHQTELADFFPFEKEQEVLE